MASRLVVLVVAACTAAQAQRGMPDSWERVLARQALDDFDWGVQPRQREESALPARAATLNAAYSGPSPSYSAGVHRGRTGGWAHQVNNSRTAATPVHGNEGVLDKLSSKWRWPWESDPQQAQAQAPQQEQAQQDLSKYDRAGEAGVYYNMDKKAQGASPEEEAKAEAEADGTDWGATQPEGAPKTCPEDWCFKPAGDPAAPGSPCFLPDCKTCDYCAGVLAKHDETEQDSRSIALRREQEAEIKARNDREARKAASPFKDKED
jgi:hypothetical protein